MIDGGTGHGDGETAASHHLLRAAQTNLDLTRRILAAMGSDAVEEAVRALDERRRRGLPLWAAEVV